MKVFEAEVLGIEIIV